MPVRASLPWTHVRPSVRDAPGSVLEGHILVRTSRFGVGEAVAASASICLKVGVLSTHAGLSLVERAEAAGNGTSPRSVLDEREQRWCVGNRHRPDRLDSSVLRMSACFPFGTSVSLDWAWAIWICARGDDEHGGTSKEVGGSGQMTGQNLSSFRTPDWTKSGMLNSRNESDGGTVTQPHRFPSKRCPSGDNVTKVISLTAEHQSWNQARPTLNRAVLRIARATYRSSQGQTPPPPLPRKLGRHANVMICHAGVTSYHPRGSCPLPAVISRCNAPIKARSSRNPSSPGCDVQFSGLPRLPSLDLSHRRYPIGNQVAVPSLRGRLTKSQDLDSPHNAPRSRNRNVIPTSRLALDE